MENSPSTATEADPEPSLWSTIKGDFANATGARVLGVLGMMIWMAFQWGWGNDVLLPPIVARAFDAIDDSSTWPSAIGAIGAGTVAGSGFWGITQAFDGVVVLAGFGLIPATTARISRTLRRHGLVKPYHELSFGTRFFVAYLSGASVLCLIDVMATGRPGLQPRRRILAEAVAMAVAGVAIVIVVITSAIAIGARVPATEGAAEFVVRYARNPLTWLALYGTLALGSAIAGRLRGRDTSPSPAPTGD